MNAHMTMPRTGAAASAGMGTLGHGRAMQGGHAAAQRLAMARNLGGAGGAPQGQPEADFRAHVAQASGLPNVSPQEVHGAIEGLAAAGHLSPLQAHALVGHHGPLHGHGGKATIHKIAQAVKVRRPGGSAQGAPQAPLQTPRPMPQVAMPQPGGGLMPAVANGGMPAGLR